ncbi:MAG: hypothetical protein PSX36_00180 [bacterium]|nr:hypothetical protein [bacterium]
MEKDNKYFTPHKHRNNVDVVHILNDGNVVLSLHELEPFEGIFEWVDRTIIANLIDEMIAQTDGSRKSIIAIYENGDIKTHTNISMNFTKYGLLSKIML